jgi:hypothetical protein
MLEILAALPEEAREDVVHLNEDGTVYTNRVANKGNTTILHKDEETGTWLDQNGDIYPLALPSQSPNPLAVEEPVEEVEEAVEEAPAITIEPLAVVTPLCRLDGSGIEFRMHTKPGGSSSSVPPLTGSRVKVTVPSKASGNILVNDPSGYGCTRDLQQPLGETPYVYLGGWGGDYNPSTHPYTRVTPEL